LDGICELYIIAEGRPLIEDERLRKEEIAKEDHPNDTILSALGSSESDFPRGHPSWYCYRRSMLDYGVLIGS
jgi:hypothetical protein